MVAAADVVGKARVVDEVRPPHQLGPAAKHGVADHRHHQPAVAGAVDVGRGGVVAGVALLPAHDAGELALDEQRLHEGNAGGQQRHVHQLPLAAALPLVERRQGPKGTQQAGAKVLKRHHVAQRRPGKAGKRHRPRHALHHGVKAHAVGVRTVGTKGRGVHQDDVGFDGAQRLVVKAHGAQHVNGQVGHYHVAGGHQAVGNFLPLGVHGIQGQALLVAVNPQKQRPFPCRGHRRQVAVFAAAAALDANHLCPHVPQQGSSKRPGDVAAKVQDANPFQHPAHVGLPRVAVTVLAALYSRRHGGRQRLAGRAAGAGAGAGACRRAGRRLPIHRAGRMAAREMAPRTINVSW
ncbi:MAG: hypothetical protein KatS3mg131_1351 [Candidatus Tectimicrobiota bacterium]|nr:MAG: hypothetical protein KatS3mg131_1351 [Candidatus Tectomicrobia bacterium]